MPTEKSARAPVPSGPHTPTSNQPEEMAEAAGKPVSQPPSEGTQPRTNPPREDGTEEVKGHRRTKLVDPTEAGAETAAADLFVAPHKELRDIGEASFGPPPPLAETVHGPDDRVQINTTTSYPWRAIASPANHGARQLAVDRHRLVHRAAHANDRGARGVH